MRSHSNSHRHISHRRVLRNALVKFGLTVGATTLLIGTSGCQYSDLNPWLAFGGMPTSATTSESTEGSDSNANATESNAKTTTATFVSQNVREDSQDHTHYSAWSVLYPGSTVYMPKSLGWTSCSLTMVGHQGGQKVGISAGHCFSGNSTHEVLWQSAGSGYKRNVGTMTEMRRWGKQAPTSDYWFQDIGIFTLKDSVPTENTIAGRYRITKVIGSEDITKGTEICKYGYRSKETCGTVNFIQEDRIGAKLLSLPGDSGAPAFVKLDGNDVALIGALKGSPENDDNYTYFSTVKPILDEKGITLD